MILVLTIASWVGGISKGYGLVPWEGSFPDIGDLVVGMVPALGCGSATFPTLWCQRSMGFIWNHDVELLNSYILYLPKPTPKKRYILSEDTFCNKEHIIRWWFQQIFDFWSLFSGDMDPIWLAQILFKWGLNYPLMLRRMWHSLLERWRGWLRRKTGGFSWCWGYCSHFFPWEKFTFWSPQKLRFGSDDFPDFNCI